MHQSKKGNQWYFGMKAHIGVDSKEGIVHSVCSTAASVSDVHMLPDLLHGDEKKVWGDAGYQGQTEAIHQASPDAQDMTSRRVKTKAGADEAEKRKNRTKSAGAGQGGVALPRAEASLRLCEGALSRLEEEPRMAMRGLRAGQSLPEPQAADEAPSTAGPARGVVCPPEAAQTLPADKINR
jgi:hypothetical protein